MPSFDEYMSQYGHEHTNAWNKVLHAIGNPLILAGLVLLALTCWRIELLLLIAGWVLLIAGWVCSSLGTVSKETSPHFFRAIYLLVGPIWIAKEARQLLSVPFRRSKGGR